MIPGQMEIVWEEPKERCSEPCMWLSYPEDEAWIEIHGTSPYCYLWYAFDHEKGLHPECVK